MKFVVVDIQILSFTWSLRIQFKRNVRTIRHETFRRAKFQKNIHDPIVRTSEVNSTDSLNQTSKSSKPPPPTTTTTTTTIIHSLPTLYHCVRVGCLVVVVVVVIHYSLCFLID